MPLAAVVEDATRQAVVEDSVPHAVVEDSVAHAAAAVDDVADSVLHVVVQDSVSHAVVQDSAPHAVVVEDSVPQAVVGDSVRADAVFPSGSSDVAVSFGSCADLATANCASHAGSGDVAGAVELPVVGVGCRAAVPDDAEQDVRPVPAATRLPRADDEHSSVDVLKNTSPVSDSEFPKVVPRLVEESLFDRPLNDVAIAPAIRFPRADEHSSVEVWKPVLNSKCLKVVPDVDGDACDDFAPIAACVPELCDARFFVSW